MRRSDARAFMGSPAHHGRRMAQVVICGTQIVWNTTDVAGRVNSVPLFLKRHLEVPSVAGLTFRGNLLNVLEIKIH
jgi:hypothetical protein